MLKKGKRNEELIAIVPSSSNKNDLKIHLQTYIKVLLKNCNYL